MSKDTLKLHVQRLRKRDADSFYGLCLGMLSDGEVNQTEAEFLLSWLNARPELEAEDPLIGDIHWKLKRVFDDEVMDDGKALQLLKLLTAYTGCPIADSKHDQAVSTLPLCDPSPLIEFRDKTFCFTGSFSLGERSRCVDILKKFGGKQAKNITLKLDYLVVGHNVTIDWKHQSYGTKVVKAMKYRDERGRPISIVSEKRWLDSMRLILKSKKEKA